MEILNKIVYVVMLLSAIGIVVLVLLQHGKGADMGTGFGAGASGSLFGATGSANFLSRTTAILAAVFFAATLALAYFATNRPKNVGGGVMQNLPAQTAPAPAVPADGKGAPAGAIPATTVPTPDASGKAVEKTADKPAEKGPEKPAEIPK